MIKIKFNIFISWDHPNNSNNRAFRYHTDADRRHLDYTFARYFNNGSSDFDSVLTSDAGVTYHFCCEVLVRDLKLPPVREVCTTTYSPLSHTFTGVVEILRRYDTQGASMRHKEHFVRCWLNRHRIPFIENILGSIIVTLPCLYVEVSSPDDKLGAEQWRRYYTEQLPTLRYLHEKKVAESKECGVCTDEIPADNLLVFECSHIVCFPCFKLMCSSSAAAVYCPYCRAPVPRYVEEQLPHANVFRFAL